MSLLFHGEGEMNEFIQLAFAVVSTKRLHRDFAGLNGHRSTSFNGIAQLAQKSRL
jgi:hypothetical protein